MKLLLGISLLISIALCIPLEPKEYEEGDRYVYMPDGWGHLYLVDLQDPVDHLQRVEASRINFYLFTRANPSRSQELHVNDANGLRNSNFDASKPVQFVVHGWMSSDSSSENPTITAASLANEDVNVICVDWSRYSVTINYNQASRNVPLVGVVVADFIDFLVGQGASLSRMNLAGFSLGGHVVGSAGRHIRSGRVSRITSMDPAGPNFGSGNGDRINENDGGTVEVIHTNAGYLGNGDQLGHVDFFPNGGRSQPGCILGTCSHMRAYELYAESIGNQDFMGVKCDTLTEARRERCSSDDRVHLGGENWGAKSGRGIFHFGTNRRSPYALG